MIGGWLCATLRRALCCCGRRSERLIGAGRALRYLVEPVEQGGLLLVERAGPVVAIEQLLDVARLSRDKHQARPAQAVLIDLQIPDKARGVGLIARQARYLFFPSSVRPAAVRRCAENANR